MRRQYSAFMTAVLEQVTVEIGISQDSDEIFNESCGIRFLKDIEEHFYESEQHFGSSWVPRRNVGSGRERFGEGRICTFLCCSDTW